MHVGGVQCLVDQVYNPHMRGFLHGCAGLLQNANVTLYCTHTSNETTGSSRLGHESNVLRQPAPTHTLVYRSGCMSRFAARTSNWHDGLEHAAAGCSVLSTRTATHTTPACIGRCGVLRISVAGWRVCVRGGQGGM